MNFVNIKRIPSSDQIKPNSDSLHPVTFHSSSLFFCGREDFFFVCVLFLLFLPLFVFIMVMELCRFHFENPLMDPSARERERECLCVCVCTWYFVPYGCIVEKVQHNSIG